MARHRFEREALAASALNHPHIVTVYEAGETDGHPYLVTEIVDAGTLDAWRASSRPTWRQVADLLAGVADARLSGLRARFVLRSHTRICPVHPVHDRAQASLGRVRSQDAIAVDEEQRVGDSRGVYLKLGCAW